MKNGRKLLLSLFAFCLLWLSFPLVGYSADTTAALNPVTVTMSEQQYETLKGSIKTLKENSIKQSNIINQQSQQIKTLKNQLIKSQNQTEKLKQQLTISQAQMTNSQGSMQKTQQLLNEQSKSLTTLTEQVNKESHKRMVAQRQRDTWAVLAGLFLCSSAYGALN